MRKLNQTGSFIIWFTLSFALLGTFVGFALDFGRAYLEKARIARLVDAASLAAAKVLKGQPANENAATRAACDSMAMNDAPVVMASATSCAATVGAPFTATVEYFNLRVPGGPDIRAARIKGTEPVQTTFLRFLSWMVPGSYSTITVKAQAEAAPERPVDLMLVLDRSGSMNTLDGNGIKKIAALKTAVTNFISLQNTFSVNDRVGLISFSGRGCGSAGADNPVDGTCTADRVLDNTALMTPSNMTNLTNDVNALCGGAANLCAGGTNTMEALRTARTTLSPVFNDATRVTTRKAVLLVTDGQPTAVTLLNDGQCKSNPASGASFPTGAGTNGTSNSGGGPFNNGCKMTVPGYVTTGNTIKWLYRQRLASTTNCYVSISTNQTGTICPANSATPGSNNATNTGLYLDILKCARSMTGCATNGAMYEANQIRNCGYLNSACAAGGQHDVLIFSIAIGNADATQPQGSMDKNAKCLLARISNATDVVNTATGVVENLTSICTGQITTVDGDTHADLNQGWPAGCGTPPCIDTTQEKGKVYIVDVNGDVNAQLQIVFQDIALILKLRLVL